MSDPDDPAEEPKPAAGLNPPQGEAEAEDGPPGSGAEGEAQDDAKDDAAGAAPPPKAGLWSRLSAAASKAASATKDAAGKVAQVTAEVTRETVSVVQKGASDSASMARHAYEHMDEVGAQTGAAFAKVGKGVSDATVGIAQSASKTIATASTDAIKALVRNVNETLPYIERAGYRVSEIELGLTVPPKVLMHLMLGPELSDEVREALLKDCEGKWFTRQLIERLHNVRQIQRATQFVGMAFDEIEVEIALIPSVLLHYRKIHRHIALPVVAPLADAAQAKEDQAEVAVEAEARSEETAGLATGTVAEEVPEPEAEAPSPETKPVKSKRKRKEIESDEI